MGTMATDTGTGTSIRLARERRQWSQQQLAAACGVDVKTVRNWEKTGKIRNRQGLIEEVLGISLSGEVQPPTTREALDRAQQLVDELARVLKENREKGNGDENGDTRRAG
jgi:ribosome-binding protein aMBF1 (putative translation factor)